MSTHNLCFEAKIRKIGIPLHTPVLLYKSGVYITRTCFPDDKKNNNVGPGCVTIERKNRNNRNTNEPRL